MGRAFPPRATLPGETRDCWGAARREPACGGPVKGSAAILAGRLSRDGVGTCASRHNAGPPGVRKHFVHWWSGSNVCMWRWVGGGGWVWYRARGGGGCGNRLACGGSGACGGSVDERMVARGIERGCEVGVHGGAGVVLGCVVRGQPFGARQC
jgi:hypothetical protein